MVPTIRYLTDPKQRKTSEESIREYILSKFAECNDIDFSYPTQRFYNYLTEGKENARADKPDEDSQIKL